MDLEEQFECVSNHLLESAQRSAAEATREKRSTASTAHGTAASSKQPAAAATPAEQSALSWEEELRAELS